MDKVNFKLEQVLSVMEKNPNWRLLDALSNSITCIWEINSLEDLSHSDILNKQFSFKWCYSLTQQSNNKSILGSFDSLDEVEIREKYV